MPEEVLKARVVLLFKKGDTTNCSNYRPISLLNTVYKIFAALLHRLIADTLDPHLHALQFGFRNERSTANALHMVRRMINTGESTQTNAYLLLLDWEKAFDKVLHPALFNAMKRLNVDPKVISLTKMLYSKPMFCTKIDGVQSD